MFKISNTNQSHLLLLLKPSWLSGLVAVFVGLFITIGVITAFTVSSSAIQQQLVAWQQNQPAKPVKPLTAPGQIVSADDKPTLSGSWPLLVFWTLIGLVVYGASVAIISSLNNAEELREELSYANARPDNILKTAAGHLVLRLIAAAMLAVFIILFFKQVIPYSITAAHAASADFFSSTGPLYAFLSFAIVAVTLHLQTICLRLALGRPRIFSSF